MKIKSNNRKNIAIIGNHNEFLRISKIIRKVNPDTGFIGQISNNETLKNNHNLGQIHQLQEIIKIHKLNEVIFSSKDITANKIMKHMSNIKTSIDIKIAPTESTFIIGSNSIHSKGDLRIDGTLKGSVSTEGRVVLGKEGVIEGDVACRDADISGVINAKITVSQLLSLKATAKLNGDITTNKLSIEPGATFTGSCSMGAVIKEIKHVEKPEKKEKTA